MTQKNVDLFGMSELELAGIDEETFEKLVKVELAEKGVFCPVPIDDYKPGIPGPTDTIWGVTAESKRSFGGDECNFFFETYEDAKAFVDLNPFPVFHDYELPFDMKQKKTVNGYSIFTTGIYDTDFVNENYPSFKEEGDNESFNRKRKSNMSDEKRAYEDAVKPYNTLRMARLEALSRMKHMEELYDMYMEAFEVVTSNEKERHDKCIEVLEKKFDREEIDFWLKIEG